MTSTGKREKNRDHEEYTYSLMKNQNEIGTEERRRRQKKNVRHQIIILLKNNNYSKREKKEQRSQRIYTYTLMRIKMILEQKREKEERRKMSEYKHFHFFL